MMPRAITLMLVPLILTIEVFPSTLTAHPGQTGKIDRIVVLCNDYDYSLCWPHLYWEGEIYNYIIKDVTPAYFDQFKESKFLLILGGPLAYDGVGEIVSSLLSEDEKQYLMSDRDSRIIAVRRDVWTDGQIVVIAAGYDRYDTESTVKDINGNGIADALEPIVDQDGDGVSLNIDPNPEVKDLADDRYGAYIREFVDYSLKYWSRDELQASLNWFLSWDRKYEILDRIEDHDIPGAALYILSMIRIEAPEYFNEYYKLAIATSITWDNPLYVQEKTTVNDVVGIFRVIAGFNEDGETYYDLKTMEVELLTEVVGVYFLDPGIFMVDGGVGGFGPKPEELVYLHGKYYTPIHDTFMTLTIAYMSVPYTLKRTTVLPNMTIRDIETKGGACVVQAYYARCVAAALGIPTRYVAGFWKSTYDDEDVGHAFLAYFDDGKWMYGIASIAFDEPVEEEMITPEFLSSRGFTKMELMRLNSQAYTYVTIINWEEE